MKPSIGASTVLLPFLALLPLAACGGDPEVTAIGRQVADVPPEPITDLDVLFVIDNSGSMGPHQQALIDAARDSLFGQLEAELDGLPNLQIGVVTTSLGSDPYTINGCTSGGDGGRLLVQAGIPGCDSIQNLFLRNVAGPDGTRETNYEGELADAFACLASVGTQGCGFEQPFAAMQRALDGTVPDNAGFLRPEAMLLVVFLSDEDDCSVSDPAFFDPDNEALGDYSSHRCFAEGIVCDNDDPQVPGVKTNCHSREDSAYISPVAGYVDFLNGVKGDPTKVMVAGLFGKPDYFEVVVDEYDPDILGLASVCGNPDELGTGAVWPSPRMQELVSAFPARYELGDLCEALSGGLASIARTTGMVMSGAPCLLGPIADQDSAASGLQPSCKVYDVTAPRQASEQRVEVPSCASTGGAAPCFDLRTDASRCAATASGLAVERQGVRPPGTHLVVECAEAAPL